MNNSFNFLADTIHALKGTNKKPSSSVNNFTKTKSQPEAYPESPKVEAVITSREKPAKMNVSLPESLHRRFASRCTLEGRTKSGTIQYLIKQFLADQEGGNCAE